MKRIIILAVFIFFFLCAAQAALASDDLFEMQDFEAPDAFLAEAIYGPEGNMAGKVYFKFADGAPTVTSYSYDIAGSITVTRKYSLTYCKTSCNEGADIFITGSFTETKSDGGGEHVLIGHVEGQFMRFDNGAPDISLSGKTLIMLAHYPDSYDGIEAPESLQYFAIYLEPVDWVLPGNDPVQTQTDEAPQSSHTVSPAATPSHEVHSTPSNDLLGGGLFDTGHTDAPYSQSVEESHHHESDSSGISSARKNVESEVMPDLAGPIQVAAGAVLISLLAALANLPSSAAGSGMGAFAYSPGSNVQNTALGIKASARSAQSASGEPNTSSGNDVLGADVRDIANAGENSGGAADMGSASASSSAASSGSYAPSIQMGPAEAVGGAKFDLSEIFEAIMDFIKKLIVNLRDMLVDEGRSFTSGKMSEMLDIEGEGEQ